MRKKIVFSVLAGAVVTAVSIILTDPLNGKQLVEELEAEEKVQLDKINKTIKKES